MIEKGYLMPNHVHVMVSIPPKCAVSQVVEFVKGRSAIHIARVYRGWETQLRGPASLGEKIFRVHGGPR